MLQGICMGGCASSQGDQSWSCCRIARTCAGMPASHDPCMSLAEAAHLWETGILPLSAPRSISLDQLTESTCVGIVQFLALCSSGTAPGLKEILRPTSMSASTTSYLTQHSS